MSYVDLFLIHSPYGGLNVETYQALLDLKTKGVIRSVIANHIRLTVYFYLLCGSK